jgi:hypothetical protein
VTGNIIAGELERAKSAKQAASGVLRAIVAQIIASAFQKVIAGVPFPANVALAPIAAVAAGKTANALIPAFQSGGLVGGGEKLIRVNEAGTEFVTNANTTRAALPLLSAMNANPALASAMNNQFTGQVSLNDNGLTDRMGSMVDKMGDVVFRFENGQFIGGFRELQRIDNERIARTE